MRVHGYKTDTEFWRYGSEVEGVARTYLELRYRMFPYLYSEAAAVTLKGSSLLRPLIMDFVDDPEALDQKYEFMFGHEIMVAPVTTPSTEQMNVYLPRTEHGWFNFWTGEHVAGGATLPTDAKIDRIPVFVRAGAVLPWGPAEQYISQEPAAGLELRVYPGADADFDLYEDEGTNYNYEHGAFSSIKLRWNDSRHELTIGRRNGSFPGMRPVRDFQIRLIGTSAKQQIVKYRGDEVHITLK